MENTIEVVVCYDDGTVDVGYQECYEGTCESRLHQLRNDASLGAFPFDDTRIERVYIDGMRVI